MRNLTIHQVHHKNLEFMRNKEIDQELLSNIQCAINPSCYDIYILSGNCLYTLPLSLPLSFSDITVLDFSFQSQLDFSKIIAMEYCITLQEIYCAYESGIIAKIDIRNSKYIDYSIVTAFDSGLQCMKFSPDHEVIVAVTGAGIVTLMVLDFQIIAEVDLYSEEFGQDKFVNVGWGKKETQFHGSMGKAAAQTKPEQLIPNELDDGRTQITWREDGASFAVNFLDRKSKIRKFKVFNREGLLLCTNELTNGLEKYIAWNSLGNMIAISQILNDKYIIAFFERNGLKYSELLLPFKPQEIKVKDLLWSPDILAVICHQLKTKTMLIQLWIERNSHWYLKQTLVFPVENPLLYVTWCDMIDTDKKDLIYLTTKELGFCLFNWCLNHSRGKTVDDKVVHGVIDGNKILVTAFKEGVIPPPMAHQSLETPELQNAIIFGPNIDESSSINSNDFCTLSYTNKLTFFKLIKESSTLTYVITNSCSIAFDVLHDITYKTLKVKEIHSYMLHHFLWFTEDIMLFSINVEKHNLLCVLSVNEMYSEDHLKIQEVHVLDFPVEHIVSSPDARTAYIKVKDQIFKYTHDRQLEPTNIRLKKICVQMEVVKIDSKDVIFALSLGNGFLIDGQEIAKNITSFCVHSDFLLLTTLQHTLVCVLLNEFGIKQLSKHDLTVQPWLNDTSEISLTDIYIRRLEKNSRLITAIPYESKIILQMPRGNLECIQPRALSLHILKHYLNNCDYLAALDIMTKQRINLNLIYDHDPQLFLNNMKKFVEDILQHKKLNWLNLFLSELQNEDVTRTMYAYCYSDRIVEFDAKSNKISVNKVDKICELLRDIMEKHQNTNNLIQPILISLVKNQQRQGLENALSRIKQIKMLEDSGRLAYCSASEALKYLLHFVDFDTLYNVALGMYDLELAMFVASKSSKDPKEYVPFLNNLKKLGKNYMKFLIDVYLKRYELALEHLSKDPTKFEECLNLINNHKLHKKAMKIFDKNTIQYKQVAAIYGEFLESEERYQEAGLMFYKSGNLNKALEVFCMSGDNWQEVITISKEMKLSQANLYELYKALVERLKAERKYEQAVVILREYLHDIEEAIALLCEGRFWKYALRIAIDVQRSDLTETHIKPGVKKHAEHVISELNTMKEDFLAYKSRLTIVRREIKAKQTQIQLSHEKTSNEQESNKEVPDFISDTISIADSTLSRTSLCSSKSYRSSKNRRKQERKLFSLKQGNMFEDLGLIHALYQVVNNAYKDRDEWYQLVQMLIRFNFDKSAEKILNETKELFQLIENSKSEIWDRSAPTSLVNTETNISKNYPQIQFQDIIVSIKSIERYIMYPPESNTEPRVLDIF